MISQEWFQLSQIPLVDKQEVDDVWSVNYWKDIPINLPKIVLSSSWCRLLGRLSWFGQRTQSFLRLEKLQLPVKSSQSNVWTEMLMTFRFSEWWFSCRNDLHETATCLLQLIDKCALFRNDTGEPLTPLNPLPEPYSPPPPCAPNLSIKWAAEEVSSAGYWLWGYLVWSGGGLAPRGAPAHSASAPGWRRSWRCRSCGSVRRPAPSSHKEWYQTTPSGTEREINWLIG